MATNWKPYVAAGAITAAVVGGLWYNNWKLPSLPWSKPPMVGTTEISYDGIVVDEKKVFVPSKVLDQRQGNSVYNIGNSAHQHGVYVWSNGKLSSLDEVTRKALEEPAHPTTNVTDTSAGSTSATTSTSGTVSTSATAPTAP